MSVAGGVRFIAKKQRDDGGFWEYRLDEDSGKRRPAKYLTTFSTSLIALALKEVPGGERITKKCVQFLLTEKSKNWSWNYWARASKMAQLQPYPDDLDDTFLALSALWFYEPSLFHPKMMADVARLLFQTEVEPGGPYRTWLVDEQADVAWRDVDLVVNANIAYFLSLQEVELPGLRQFLDKAIKKGKLHSPYYPAFQPAAYFLSRSCSEETANILRKKVLAYQKQSKANENPHSVALAVMTLLWCGHPVKEVLAMKQYLFAMQAADGSWPAQPMCLGPGAHPSGSDCLTTALCLQALVMCEQAEKQQVQSNAIDKQYDIVVRSARQMIQKIDQPDLKKHTTAIFDKIIAHDKDKQIVHLPRTIARAFKVTPSQTLLRNLAFISIWGWMAFMTYDDFLDNEGDPKYLPSAVVAHRYLLAVIQVTLADNREFQAEVTEILHRQDGANAWEVSHCRGTIANNQLIINNLPNYGDYWALADRSLGHMIGGLGVLYDAGFSRSSSQMEALREFFFHYLVARQLNDEAHDWEEDLARGHVNAVGVLVLQKWVDTTGRSLADGIHLKRQAKRLQYIMWKQVIDEVCTLIRDHATQARAALVKLDMDLDTTQLFALLTPLQNATDKALKARDEAVEFSASL